MIVTRYHHGNLRRALLAAARLAVEADGEIGLSLRGLAAAVGVTANAPYRHFPTRASLLVALAAEGFTDLTSRFAPFETAKGRARMLGCLTAYLHFSRENPGLYRLMFGQSLDPLSCDPALGSKAQACFVALMEAVAAVTQMKRDDERVGRNAAVIWSLSHGAALLEIDRATSFLPEPQCPTPESLAEWVMAGLGQTRRRIGGQAHQSL